MPIIYGINNCDTVKKAQKWLDLNNISYQFHDFKKQGLSAELLQSWLKITTLETLINKRSTTYRNLSDGVKNNLTLDLAIKTMLEQPTLVKRPVLLANESLYIGFKPAQYQEIFPND